MNWIVSNMKWIMLVAGLLTCTMIYLAIAPQAALQHTFGETIDGPIADIVVRNWGILIALVGLMLIYGAFSVAVRPLVLTVAGVSKLAFATLVLTIGQSFLGSQAITAVVVDLIEAALFAIYLIATRRRSIAV